MPPTPRPKITARLVVAHFKYWSWWLLSKCLLGIICLGVMAEGIRLMVPALGMKLYRIPGLSFAKHFEETHALDVAPFLSLFFMILTWHMAEKVITIWLIHKPPLPTEHGAWNQGREAVLVNGIGTVLLLVDAILFYAASATMTWGGNSFALAPLIATGGYLAVLLGVSYVSAKLAVAVDSLRDFGTLSSQENLVESPCPFEKKMTPLLAQLTASKALTPVVSHPTSSKREGI